MPRRDSEVENDAPPPPGFTMATKAICKDGAGHADSSAEETESKSDTDDEKEFDKSTGKNLKRNYNGYYKYRLVKEWVTREAAVLEEAEIIKFTLR